MATSPLALAVNEGRLVELRGEGHLSISEFNAFRTHFTDTLVKLGRRVVIIADLRRLKVSDPAVYGVLFDAALNGFPKPPQGPRQGRIPLAPPAP